MVFDLEMKADTRCVTSCDNKVQKLNESIGEHIAELVPRGRAGARTDVTKEIRKGIHRRMGDDSLSVFDLCSESIWSLYVVAA